MPIGTRRKRLANASSGFGLVSQVVTKHWGVGDTRANIVTPYPVNSIVKGDRASQSNNGVLGSGIGRGIGLANKTANGSDVDNIAPFISPQIF